TRDRVPPARRRGDADRHRVRTARPAGRLALDRSSRGRGEGHPDPLPGAGGRATARRAVDRRLHHLPGRPARDDDLARARHPGALPAGLPGDRRAGRRARRSRRSGHDRALRDPQVRGVTSVLALLSFLVAATFATIGLAANLRSASDRGTLSLPGIASLVAAAFFLALATILL